jgi:hypothetical protein
VHLAELLIETHARNWQSLARQPSQKWQRQPENPFERQWTERMPVLDCWNLWTTQYHDARHAGPEVTVEPTPVAPALDEHGETVKQQTRGTEADKKADSCRAELKTENRNAK